MLNEELKIKIAEETNLFPDNTDILIKNLSSGDNIQYFLFYLKENLSCN
jgi:hypothetical protein